MKKPRLRYSAEITYRPVAPELVGDTPDTRPVNRLPWLCIAPEDTENERERSLARSCGSLESQGYRIEKIERIDACARCSGAGRISVKPRGWRRRTEPPLYMMRTVDCPDCAGERRERTAIQPMLTDGLGQAV